MDQLVAEIALYKYDRVCNLLSSFAEGERSWTLEDIQTFHMHYLGDEALELAARKLSLNSSSRVLDVGSGFSTTGCYLAERFGCTVFGVELQKNISEIAKRVIDRLQLKDKVHSKRADFLEIAMDETFDHFVSFLVFLHIEEKEKLFSRASDALAVGGTFYFEDFYIREELSHDENELLERVVSCPRLLTRNEYIEVLEKSGFEVLEFDDVTDLWEDFVAKRAGQYRQEDERDPDLSEFYDTISRLFQVGHLGGVRVYGRKVR
ncbi:MAG: cyclopropane fatty-acyl-phospholipid synthase-like methyltransferase [Chlamydiales bacterium]|jgi:cyclopropane fatty-acyl-phospholipid synthase-like methyltransferase